MLMDCLILNIFIFYFFYTSSVIYMLINAFSLAFQHTHTFYNAAVEMTFIVGHVTWFTPCTFSSVHRFSIALCSVIYTFCYEEYKTLKIHKCLLK